MGTIGRFTYRESEVGFPAVDILVEGILIAKINCLAVEERVMARRQSAGDGTLMVTEDDIEWALGNARIGEVTP